MRGLSLVLFFASGASALAYQAIWGRMLGLVFGNTAFASSTVLSVFMAGLPSAAPWAGAGSRSGGPASGCTRRWSRSRRSPGACWFRCSPRGCRACTRGWHGAPGSPA